jgi:hypothetical protein
MRPSTLVALLFAGLVQAAPLPQQHSVAAMPSDVYSTTYTTSAATFEEDDVFPQLIRHLSDSMTTYVPQYASTTTTGKAPIVVKRSEPIVAQYEPRPEFVTLNKRQPKWPGFIVEIAQRIAGVISNSILGMLGSA